METAKYALIQTGLSVGISLILGILIVIFVYRQIKHFYANLNEEHYTVRLSKSTLVVGFITSLTFAMPLVLNLLFPDEKSEWVSIVVPGLFFLMGIFLIFYYLTWRIDINQNKITVYCPFKKVLQTSFNEISLVRQNDEEIIVYIEDKKAFSVDKNALGLELLVYRLYDLGKLEATKSKNWFVVKQSKMTLVIGLYGVLFSGGSFVYMTFWQKVTTNAVVYLLMSLAFVSSLFFINYYRRWRMDVELSTIQFRPALGSKKDFYFRDITKVHAQEGCIVLYVGNKNKIKVSESCEGYPILIEKLSSENIPFVSNNRSIS